ncbi:hypothetical protein AYO44_10520 [Planctomycetaceae bacterium SCGC AG-212-F19]|nr:hypothetical protein AYO44_10520 [Planctomycetaceae bacterium SCGC AG-212-F19]
MSKRKRGQKGKPWHWAARNCWCVTVAGTGKRVKLLIGGPEEEAKAIEIWHQMMARGKVDENQDDNLIKVLADEYLAHKANDVEPDTLRNKVIFLQSFADAFPDLTVKQLKPFHVTKWLGSNPTWKSDSTKWTAHVCLDAVLNWAWKTNLITRNPIRGMRKPRLGSRGAEAEITLEQHKELLNAVPWDVAQVLIALEQTACRPKEVFQVEARNVDFRHRLWTLDKHKTARKTGRNKIVTLTDTMLALCQKLCLKHPDGPIFRTRQGQPWTTIAFCHRMDYWAKKLKLKGKPTAYYYRHTFTTTGLEKGISDTLVAAALGHANTTMLHKNYSHVAAKVDVIRNVVESVVSVRTETA